MTGSHWIEKDQARVSPRPACGKRGGGRVGQCDLVCVEHLWMIGLMMVMLMSYSRVMSMVFILWGVGLVLRNESQIE